VRETEGKCQRGKIKKNRDRREMGGEEREGDPKR
jgi:hypothetical protein